MWKTIVSEVRLVHVNTSAVLKVLTGSVATATPDQSISIHLSVSVCVAERRGSSRLGFPSAGGRSRKAAEGSQQQFGLDRGGAPIWNQ